MLVAQAEGLALSLAGREIFRGISWRVGERARVGLVGPNGSGKSSLLACVAGVLQPDAGSVRAPPAGRIGLLPQDVVLARGRMIDVASEAPPELAACEAHLAEIEARIAAAAERGDERGVSRALARQEEALARFESLGGARHAGRVRELLARLGFDESDWSLPTEGLSGGQKKLVALVRLAAQEPELLLLDEPDNHLDLRAKRRLEAFIHGLDAAVVVVSHDRYLLDEVATEIAELEEGRLRLYAGNYSAYRTERELARLRQQRLHVAQQKEIGRIEASIRRFELWASMVVNERHIKQARSRRKRLERMEESGELVDAVREARRMKLSLDAASTGAFSEQALQIEQLAMGFDGEPLFVGVDLLLRHGDRVGLIGSNGSGKSVLFDCVLGRLAPLEGSARVGPSTRLGHYAQEHQTLDAWLDRTPLERVRDVAPMAEGAAVAFLLRFLFQYEQMRQPIRTLSGGERSRLQLACLVLERPNLLLLDEPTNNLDIPSAEVLEAALDDFDGAILVISHDRYFLDRVVDRVAALEDGGLEIRLGGYTDYLEAARS